MPRTGTGIAASLALLAVLLASGCTAGSNDLQAWVAAEKAKKGTPLPPVPVVRTFESFQYQDADRRDPFVSALAEEAPQARNDGPRPDESRPKQPLEAFALDSLAMVGTIGTGKSMLALIRDPAGKIYRVRVGQYMGQNYGEVTAVEESRTDLSELIADGNGGWVKRDASLALNVR